MLSRAADNLYWINRYLERAETTARLIYNHVNLMLGQSPEVAEQQWRRLFASVQMPMPDTESDGTDPAFTRIHYLAFDRENPNSIRFCISAARENARQVREQISSEMWEQINRLYLDLSHTDLHSIWDAQPHEFFREIENGICLFRGITTSTRFHDEGWNFLEAGTYIERIRLTATLLDVHFGEQPLASAGSQTSEYLRSIGLLRSCRSFEAYCRQYTPTVQPFNIAEFLILNPNLPRSLRFCSEHLHMSLQQVAARTETRRTERLHRLSGRLQARLRYGQIDEIFADGIRDYLADVMRQCDQIHAAIYQTYIDYAIEGEFAA
jgi:uncharacterized alpha-E superfamily protein